MSNERWFIYFFADDNTYHWCEMHDEARLSKYNRRLNKGGCVFTHAGYCTMAANKSFMEWGKKKSPLDLSKIDIIMEDEEPMKVTIQQQEETGLKDWRLALELEKIEELCPKLVDFLSNHLDKIEDIYSSPNILMLYIPDRETAARTQAFIEKGVIDADLQEAHWVKIDGNYWLSLTFIRKD